MSLAEIISSPWFITILFFLIAFVYSSVGLGGGSSYTALMAILGFGTLVIPMISLSLNLLVTTIGSYNFIRHKHARIRLIIPFLVSSIPMAYLGGALRLPSTIFYWVLLVSLCFVAARIYLWQNTRFTLDLTDKGKLAVSLLAGSVLGFIAGVAGIGGGIYLVPLIIILGLGSEKEAATCGVIFIWINSLFGLISRLQYNSIDLTNYLPLLVAVLLGGILGSWLGAVHYAPRTMEKILGIIILLAILALGRKLLFY